MDMEALARAVTRKVLEQLRPAPATVCVLVLGARDAALAKRLAEELEPGTRVCFQDEEPCAGVPVRCILPFLSCGDMADLAAGRTSGAQAACVLQLLLSGRKVEVLDLEYPHYHDTAPAALYALYESHEKTLRAFGLARFSPRKAQGSVLRESLITAAHVERARKAGARALVVPQTALVTPAAADAAQSLGIGIDKRL